MTSPVTIADAPLRERYPDAALAVFDAEERARFLDRAGRPRHPEMLPWEVLYRLEPELYARLIAGERLHEGILAWLPQRSARVLEVGAGSGRLTLDLAARANSVLAVEPAAGLRGVLERRLAAAGVTNVTVRRGFFDALPAAATAFDLVVSCSAFAIGALDDPDRCLAALESRCAPSGRIVVIWPDEPAWLCARGFEHAVFEGPMLVEYASVAEAAALARIFYPEAAADVAARGSRFVDFATLGMSAPRHLCWKRVR